MALPIPQINDENRAFWTGGADGELRFERCQSCGYYLHPPSPRCPKCWSDDVAPEAVSGRGTVYTYTINRQQWMPGLEVPFVLAVVELDEQPGLRLIARVVDCDAPTIGMVVDVAFEARGEAFIPFFPPRVMSKFEDDCIISGIGQSEVGRRVEKGVMALTLDAALEAIGDAGLKPADIDGVISWPGAVSRADGLAPSSPGSSGPGPHAVIDALRLNPIWYYGGPETPGMFAAVIHACMAVASGLCKHVLVYRALNEATVWRTVTERVNSDAGGVAGAMQWMLPFGAFSGPNWMGLYATRHMYEYGTTREQLAAIALNARRNAQRNPKAVLQGDLTMDDYLSSKMISDPLCLFDCDIAVDGATALIVSTREHVSDMPGKPIHFEAVGSALGGRASWDQWEDMTQTAAASAGAHMWSRTDLKPADVDVANLYDGFTVLTLFWLEGLGFCAKGEGGPFVEGGSRIALDGELPLATSGGQLSAGRLHGFGHLYEACLQLRGQAEDRQVAGARVAAVSAGAGPLASCLLLRADA